MEVTRVVHAGVSAAGWPRAKLLREPLSWGALAAFLGAGLGLLGTIRRAILGDSFYVDPVVLLLAEVPGFVGEAFAMASLLGAVYLIWNVLGGTGRRLAFVGMASLALLLMGEAVGVASSIYWSTGDRWQGYAAFPFPGLEAAALYAIFFLPPVVLLPFTALALVAREKRIGVLLLCLFSFSLPFGALWFWLFPPDTGTYAEPSTEIFLYLVGWYSAGVSLIEAPLWVLLGLVFLSRARGSALGEAFRIRERENLKSARRLYERGLGLDDASVIDDLVSEDFRDPRRVSCCGKPGMKRVFSALWESYPDLSVSIEEQEAEGNLVRTRLTLSGTDRGGVLWYPPTGRHATFTADFVDRFSDGKLVEHSGRADTEGLLHQLGLTETPAPTEPQS
ncbi:hypothetical protein GBA63_17835 [Rubrobacter tropicus]|uniref:SnoaL-like domain-containing protein n=1 Tax=Rubrobacter tropicus TaxID=2653851 RepID=A0A6G8QD30_9ACTN|nr:ester cyclase [Rubrobacter tropicus]QIN84301.1 hypothetical protein GBA63_17835 [Rubrobacter tropicus]